MNFHEQEEDIKRLVGPVNPKAGHPDVLLIGDSITIGYTRFVRRNLLNECNIYRPKVNCRDTEYGLQNIKHWLGSNAWDLIYFNWGLHDLCYRHPNATAYGNRDKLRGTISVPAEMYEQNLIQLIEIMKAQSRYLAWASTTYVPDGETGRFRGDEERYNEIASKIMSRFNIPTNDLHAATRTFAQSLFYGAGDVHFSEQGYEKIAEVVSQFIKAQLINNKLVSNSFGKNLRGLLSYANRYIK